MIGKRAWAFCISFPETLFLLHQALENETHVDLIDKADEILDNDWSIPDEARIGDYIFHIVPPGNVNIIGKLIEELETNSNEWSSDDYEELMDALENAKEDYEQYEGKLLYSTKIKEIIKENGRRYANFGDSITIYCDVRSFDNEIVCASKEKQCMELSYVQTVEIIESTHATKENDTDGLFEINAGVPDRKKIDFGNQVQAFVTNYTFYNSLKEILEDMEYRGCLTVESLLQDRETLWTAPRWCKAGDIAFFMFAKTASAKISALTTQFRRTKTNYSIREQRIIEEGLSRGRKFYKKYGGCVFAFARVNGYMEYQQQDADSVNHWRSPFYAPMDNLTVLDYPISINDFREFLTISRQNTITPVLGDAFERLRDLIINRNNVPIFFQKANATPIPLTDINEDNWITYGMEYRRRFFLEEAFRRYYVDFLLRDLGDKKTFYRECGCYKSGGNPPRVDNIILLMGKYLPVEIKLSIYNEADLPGQVHQYCQLSYVELEKGKTLNCPRDQMYDNNVLIIDTEDVYLYDDTTGDIQKIYHLDDVTEKINIQGLRNKLISLLY